MLINIYEHLCLNRACRLTTKPPTKECIFIDNENEAITIFKTHYTKYSKNFFNKS